VGPLVAQHFSQLTQAQLRARIEDTNHRVATENNTEFLTYWVLEPAAANHMVQLYHFPDALRADQMYKSQKSQGLTVARDGNQVLVVILPPPAAAEALLARLIR
jgi:hypothetical protein